MKEISRDQYAEYLSDLFNRASDVGKFDFICALLRVSGLEDESWDPFEELKGAFEDYNYLLDLEDDNLSDKHKWRMGLLMYCQLIEMSAPHEMLANLLRCLKAEKYQLKPFGHLGRANKKIPFSWVPPSAKAKFRQLKQWAEEQNENSLCEHIDSFFNDDLRNSFTHSDYVISNDGYRWTESGLAQELPLETVGILVSNCFNFYGALLWLHSHWLKELAKVNTFHKWPDYMVLELLSHEDQLYGFNVHFSNGTKATYARTDKGTECININLENDGTFNFFVGCLDDLVPEWKVDGKVFET